ncbi:MAG: hypothetical protein Q8P50_12910 [Bacillota bacterium]|nr:hypothetical protein [Bacillota bacterium]
MKIPDAILRQLLEQSELSPTEKIVCLTTAKCLPRSMNELSTKANVSKSTALEAGRKLAARRWMSFARTGRKVRPVALIPHEHQSKMVEDLETIYRLVRNRGEFLMKRYLDLRVWSDEYVDNARPEFLVNPATDEPLEYDRYYLSRVAFEFNGAQHHSTTQAFPDDKALKEMKARDLIKKALSDKAGVKLIIVTAEDLPPDAFDKLLPDDLPLNPVDKDGPYFKALVRICTAYAAKAATPGGAVQAAKAVGKK